MPEETVSILAKLIDGVSGPSVGVIGSLGGIRGALTNLKNLFNPITGDILSFLGAFAGFRLVTESLRAAKEEVQAIARLRSALGNNSDQLQRILDQSAEVQKRTVVGDEKVIALAADLLNRGVSVTKLNTAIEASVQLAAALGTGVEEAGVQIAQTFLGIIPKSLSKIPEIRKLTEEQLKHGAALSIVLQRYKGTAEAIAGTAFGKAEQEANKLSDVYERLGKQFVRIQVSIFPAVVKAFEGFANSLENESGQKFLELLTHMAPALIKIALGFVSVGIAGKAIGTVTALVKILFGILFSGPALFIALGIGLAAWMNGWKSLPEVMRNLKQLFEDLAFGIDVLSSGGAAGDAWGKVFVAHARFQLKTLFPNIAEILALLHGDTSVLTFENSDAMRARFQKELDAEMASISSQFKGLPAISGDETRSLVNARKQKDEAIRSEALKNRQRLEVELANLELTGETKSGEDILKAKLDRLQAEFNLRKISLREFLAFTEDLERKDLEGRRTLAQGDLTLATQERARLDDLRKTNDLRAQDESKINDAIAGQIAAKRELLEVDQKLNDLAVQQAARRVELAQKVANEAESKLQVVTTRNADLVRVGALSSREAVRLNSEAFKQYTVRIEESTAAIQEQIDKTSDPKLKASLLEDLRAMQDQAEVAASQIQYTSQFFARSIRDGMEGPLTDFFRAGLNNIHDLGQAFGKMLQDMGGKLLDFVASEAANAFLDLLAGGRDEQGHRGGGVFGFLGGIFSGLFGFAEGGLVPGSGPNVDSVPAMLAPREFVQPRGTVDYYGADIMQALRDRLIPRSILDAFRGRAPRASSGPYFASGGLVGSASGGGGGPILAVVAPSPENARRLFRGGKSELFDLLSENSDMLKQIVGR